MMLSITERFPPHATEIPMLSLPGFGDKLAFVAEFHGSHQRTVAVMPALRFRAERLWLSRPARRKLAWSMNHSAFNREIRSHEPHRRTGYRHPPQGRKGDRR